MKPLETFFFSLSLSLFVVVKKNSAANKAPFELFEREEAELSVLSRLKTFSSSSSSFYMLYI